MARWSSSIDLPVEELSLQSTASSVSYASDSIANTTAYLYDTPSTGFRTPTRASDRTTPPSYDIPLPPSSTLSEELIVPKVKRPKLPPKLCSMT